MRLVALDLVRFFAAMAVVMYHYTARVDSNSFETLSEITKFGYLGVPMFFVISGYVIALSANNRNAFEFAASRLTRLYPAFWAGIAFTVIAMTILGKNTFSINQVLANLTMLNDYFGYENIDDVYWTLQKEIKFYACIFLLVLFGVFSKIRIWLSLWLFITALYLFTKQPFFMGWFITPTYSSLFIAGIAFYLIHKEKPNRYNIFILISSLLISSFYSFHHATSFMIKPSITNQYTAVVFIWFFHLFFYALVTNKISLKNRSYYLTLGALTYPLYLIHGIAGQAIIDGPLKIMPAGLAVIVVTLFMLVFAYLIHILVEKKIATPMKNKLLNLISSIPFLQGRSKT